MDRWLDLLGRIAHQTSAETEIPTSITEKDKNPDKPPEWS
jgi:hypothetical protein